MCITHNLSVDIQCHNLLVKYYTHLTVRENEQNEDVVLSGATSNGTTVDVLSLQPTTDVPGRHAVFKGVTTRKQWKQQVCYPKASDECVALMK